MASVPIDLHVPAMRMAALVSFARKREDAEPGAYLYTMPQDE